MIQFLTGVIGSGKTYYAINYIVKNFAKNEEIRKKVDKRFQFDDLDKCITNINELKYEEFVNVNQLKFKDFYADLKVGYEAYQNDATDSELNEIEEVKRINHSLIILDECHNFLSKKDDVLVWWLSYARHMHMEVILISQDLALVDAKYKKFSEFFYKAKPSSMRIFNNYMHYNQYSDATLYNSRKTATLKVKIIPEIFDLYGSGKNIQNSSIIRKFIFLGVGLFILMFFIFYLIKSFFFAPSRKKQEEPIKQQINEPAKKQSSEIIQQSLKSENDNELLVFYCNREICVFNHNTYPFKYIFVTLKQFKYKVLYEKKTDLGFKQFFVLISTKYKKLYLDIYVEKNNVKDKELNNVQKDNFSIVPTSIFTR